MHEKLTVSPVRWLAAAIVVLVVVAVLIWRYTPLAAWASPEEIASRLSGAAGSVWTPAALVAIYVVAGYLVFPLTILIAATALIYDPLPAFGCAMVGALANAVTLYATGRYLFARKGPIAFGPRFAVIRAQLEQRGVIAMAVLRNIPVAPFTVFNLAAGAFHVRLRDYVLGTALGITPGVALVTAFGDRLRATLEHPDARSIGLLVLVIVVWAGVLLGIQWAAQKWQSKHPS